MTSTELRPARAMPATSAGTDRDHAFDVIRSMCLIVVVLLHGMMAGIERTDAGPSITNAMSGNDWFNPVSWFVQVMPLFFIAGGFTGLLQWDRHVRRGGTAAGFVARRMQRLLPPAIAMIVAVGVVLWLLGVVGIDSALLAEVGFRIGQPLWFLAVFTGVTALVPVMATFHRRHAGLTLLGLASVVLLVDVVAGIMQQPGIAYANLLFVWLFIQQLGFCLADGSVDAVPRWSLPIVAAAFLGILFGLVAAGAYPADMYANLNPPVLPLVLLGCAHAALVQWARPWLSGVYERHHGFAHLVSWIGARSMTIYAWHMPAMVLLGLVTLTGSWMSPAVHSEAWWWTRPLWLVAVVLVLIPFVIVLSPLERFGFLGLPGVQRLKWSMRSAERTRALLRGEALDRWMLPRGLAGVAAVLGATCATASITALLVFGFNASSTLISLGLAVAAMLLVARIPTTLPGQPSEASRASTPVVGD